MPIRAYPWGEDELETLHINAHLTNAQCATVLREAGYSRTAQQVNDRRRYERVMATPRDTLYEQRRKLRLRAARLEATLAKAFLSSGEARSWTEALYLVEQVAIGARE